MAVDRKLALTWGLVVVLWLLAGLAVVLALLVNLMCSSNYCDDARVGLGVQLSLAAPLVAAVVTLLTWRRVRRSGSAVWYPLYGISGVVTVAAVAVAIAQSGVQK